MRRALYARFRWQIGDGAIELFRECPDGVDATLEIYFQRELRKEQAAERQSVADDEATKQRAKGLRGSCANR